MSSNHQGKPQPSCMCGDPFNCRFLNCLKCGACLPYCAPATCSACKFRNLPYHKKDPRFTDRIRQSFSAYLKYCQEYRKVLAKTHPFQEDMEQDRKRHLHFLISSNPDFRGYVERYGAKIGKTIMTMNDDELAELHGLLLEISEASWMLLKTPEQQMGRS